MALAAAVSSTQWTVKLQVVAARMGTALKPKTSVQTLRAWEAVTAHQTLLRSRTKVVVVITLD
jgi:hypothetical protein